MFVIVAVVVVVADDAFRTLTAGGVAIASCTFGDGLAVVFVVVVVVAAATATTAGACLCGIAFSKRRGVGDKAVWFFNACVSLFSYLHDSVATKRKSFQSLVLFVVV